MDQRNRFFIELLTTSDPRNDQKDIVLLRVPRKVTENDIKEAFKNAMDELHESIGTYMNYDIVRRVEKNHSNWSADIVEPDIHISDME